MNDCWSMVSNNDEGHSAIENASGHYEADGDRNGEPMDRET